ncbi:MAG: hypothetical protein ACOC2U_04350 [bacterium]
MKRTFGRVPKNYSFKDVVSSNIYWDKKMEKITSVKNEKECDKKFSNKS